ncbi:MAG: hypothetical protein U9R41_08395, partial [Candidatus Marinimicrobia bacterium]|nr:hypothetical protein [Candidatus Neomarinimicrobiota bacterium]
NSQYELNSGNTTKELEEYGFNIFFKVFRIFPSLRIGYSYLQPIIQGPEVDLRYDKFINFGGVLSFLSFNTGFLIPIGSQKWSLSEGSYYEFDGKEVTNGNATPTGFIYPVKVSAGLSFGPFAIGLGYIKYFAPSEWSDSDYEEKNGDDVNFLEIPKELLQYKISSLGGLCIELIIII